MAIPISEYIKINTTTVMSTTQKDFCGLVISKCAMKATVPSEYASIKTAYDAGTPIVMTSTGIAACFDDTTDVAVFAVNYFGYTGGPDRLVVEKYLTATDTPKKAYERALAANIDFGSFTFLGNDFVHGGSLNSGVKTVAAQNKTAGYMMAIPTSTTNRDADASAYDGFEAVHLVQDADTLIDPGESESGDETYGNIGAWMPMAWYASSNYSAANASGTIDYKAFAGATATVTTSEGKTHCDAKHVNYIGLVQLHGLQKKFYQQGMNMDGEDIGVYRDRIWIQSNIENGWFNLVGNASKIPANASGAAMVVQMITVVAQSAVNNGAILLDKPLSNEKIALINQYAGDEDAATQVQTNGFYVAAKIVENGNRYECQYTLIYAKGDHIGKVVGSHYLV